MRRSEYSLISNHPCFSCLYPPPEEKKEKTEIIKKPSKALSHPSKAYSIAAYP
jgi:uncharacterized membrane protein YkgB